MSFGLTPEGLLIPSLTTVREALNTSLRNTFGSSIDVGDKSTLGQLTGIIAASLSALWEKLEAVNSSQDPDKATGAALEAISALTGTFRPAASYSAVVLTLTGTVGTIVSSGSKAKTASTGKTFVTTAAATIAAVNAWVGSTAYVIGNRVTNGGRIYQCITAGTSNATGGPNNFPGSGFSGSTDLLYDELDGTVHWSYVGSGVGAVDVNARAEVTGPITAFARDITVIDTSVGGWNGVINQLDAAPGRDIAQDGELRLLREQELATGGNSTVDALRAELLEVADVEAVTIFVNNTDVTDVDGVPPHAVEAMVRIPVGTTYNQSIWDALLDGVAAGIATHGTTSGSAVDEQGTAHVMKFSRPTEKLIWATLAVVVDAATFPVDGIDQIKTSIVAFGDIQKTGKDAVASAVAARAFSIAGVLDVTTCFIDDAVSPATSATVPITLRELAVYDTSRIIVTTTNGVP